MNEILIAEDEVALVDILRAYLIAESMRVRVVFRGDEVIDAVKASPPDLLILDLGLPGRDGLAVCRDLRQFSDLPVLILTARVEEVDRLIGLEAGADDYVCKPFSPREVVARVKGILRRTDPGRARGETLRLAADAERHEIRTPGGAVLALTPLEFRLMRTFIESPGRVFSRDQLLDRLHSDQRALADRAIDSHIKNLRRKLQALWPLESPIKSIYGVGFRYDPD